MTALGKIWHNKSGQGLVEYTLIVFLVVLVFWLSVKNTTAGAAMAKVWTEVTTCVSSPFACGSGS
jgi:Flp pilus assembly pilin Flp